MFLSLRHQVTKKPIQNTKCSPKFVVVVTIQKEKRQPGLFLFSNCDNRILDFWLTFCALYLVFSHRQMQRMKQKYVLNDAIKRFQNGLCDIVNDLHSKR